jgi:hypothetical protein
MRRLLGQRRITVRIALVPRNGTKGAAALRLAALPPGAVME